MGAQHIDPEIVARVAPHRVDVIGAALSVVVFGQQRRALHPVVMGLTGVLAARPGKSQFAEGVIGGIFGRLDIGERIGDPAHIDIEQSPQDLALIAAKHRSRDPARLRDQQSHRLEMFSGQSRRGLCRALNRLDALGQIPAEAPPPHLGQRQRQIAIAQAVGGPIRTHQIDRRNRRDDRHRSLVLIE